MKRFNNALTEKEMMFCEEYIIDLHATHAAIRAGYSDDSAKSTGYHLKQKPEVMAYIQELMEKRSLRLLITAENVLMELAKIGFSEPVDFEEEACPQTGPQTPKGGLESKTAGGSLETEDKPGEAPVMPAPRYNRATLYKVTEVDPVTGRRSVRWFSLTAKIAALKLLGLYLGLFKEKKVMKSPNIIFPRVDDYVPMDERKAAWKIAEFGSRNSELNVKWWMK